MPLKAILFDKDGTLIDFDQSWGESGFHVLTHLAQGDADKFQRLTRAAKYNLESRRFLPDAELIAGTSTDMAPIWAEALGRTDHNELAKEIDALFMGLAPTMMVTIGNPLEILTTLATRGYRLGIATNDVEAAALQQAELMGLLPHLDFIVGQDSGHGAKPGPGMVQGFARHVGVEPAHVALVGDSTHDLHAARAAGAIGIAVLSGPATRADLEPHADHVIESIVDLPELLMRI
jgi:phosphoglycolate phosphatase